MEGEWGIEVQVRGERRVVSGECRRRRGGREKDLCGRHRHLGQPRWGS